MRWPEELLAKVKILRRCQRAYFNSGTGLSQCKLLEKDLDRFIIEIDSPSLFGLCYADPVNESLPR